MAVENPDSVRQKSFCNSENGNPTEMPHPHFFQQLESFPDMAPGLCGVINS